jgi:hypothetical protein
MHASNQPRIALSIRQPWATLVVNGLKSVEIRRWSTSRVGWVYIHAGKKPDRTPEAWRLVPAGLRAAARQTGGLVGRARLAGCRVYASEDDFLQDERLHLASTAWFVAPRCFGFLFVEPRPIPFEPCPGSLYFFEV